MENEDYKVMDSVLEKDILSVIEENNNQMLWMQKKIEKDFEKEVESKKIINNYSILSKSVFGKIFVLPILRHYKNFNDIDLQQKKDIKVIAKSPFFDANWYINQYSKREKITIPPAEHYLLFGWKRNWNPSPLFRTKEYLELNTCVKQKGICPLLHYERVGKYEGKQYRINQADEIPELKPNNSEIQNWNNKKAKNIKRQKKMFDKIEIDSKKIVFCNFQHKYTCNTKYICNELLRRNLDVDIIWLYDPKQKDIYEYPRNVKLVSCDSNAAKKELASAHIIIDNGVISFKNELEKKSGQIGICTWHGSLGFKKMGADVEEIDNSEAIEKFTYNHDILISNSSFEDEVYRSSHWPKAEILRLGHARNDILIKCGDEQIRHIKMKIHIKYGIPFNKKFVLFAPTFRDDMRTMSQAEITKEINEKGIYNLNVEQLTDALSKKYGGEWIVLIRHHYVNSLNNIFKELQPDGMIDVTDYEDIQELMLAADAGITDYSSWILDYILTKKPAFLYVSDMENFESKRGFYYSVDESPLQVSNNMKQLTDDIEVFDQDKYEDEIARFLAEKGCIDDGNACVRIVDKIQNLIEQ